MITQKLNLDLQLSQRQPILYAKQGDALLRKVELHLFEGGRAWTVPNDLTIRQVVFCKADRHGGAYDTMPDGSTAAVAINGNVATVAIAPEVLTCAGRCAMELQLMSEDGKQITTWTWIYQIAESVERRIQSTDYWNVQSIAQMRAAIEAIQGILATQSQDIADLKSKNHLGVFIGNVPDSGEAVSASRAQFKPTANIGDFVVGQNGKIGRVQEGSDALHLEVAGLGWAISGWTDVSVDYAAAHTETPTLTPRTYLLNLPAGRYRLADGDTMLYLAEVDAVDEAERCRISAMDHDGDTTYETYINAVLVAAYTETAAGTTFTKPLQVPTPRAGSDAANKDFVLAVASGGAVLPRLLLFGGDISPTEGDTDAHSTAAFTPSDVRLGDVAIGENGYLGVITTQLTPTMFVVRSTGQQFAPGMELFLVNFTYTEGVGFSADKTLAQITAAKNAGKYVEGVFNGQHCPLVKLTNEMALFQRLVTSGPVVDLEWISVGANGCMADIIPLEMAETTETVADTAATIQPEDKHNYSCGTLTNLTIDSPPATGAWSVVFTSGSTATDCDFPDSLQWQNDTVPTINANKTYEIIVKDNRVVCGEFPIAGVGAS